MQFFKFWLLKIKKNLIKNQEFDFPLVVVCPGHWLLRSAGAGTGLRPQRIEQTPLEAEIANSFSRLDPRIKSHLENVVQLSAYRPLRHKKTAFKRIR